MTNNDLINYDLSHIWHPYSSITSPLAPYLVNNASGYHIHLSDGRILVDGMSSWWSAIHGYNHPKLNQAAKKQIDEMSHVMFGGLTHKPAIELSKKLIDITPKSLDTVFFCDSGSVAVEVAMKMAVQYQQAKGLTNKTQLATARGGYHGDTWNAMSVCDPINGMHHLYSKALPIHFFARIPELGINADNTQSIESLKNLFERHADHIAGFIIEPIVQGAGGMRFYSPNYLKAAKTLCEQYDILFIADEIATGFGRAGKLFACEYANISPDILCLGKALTGGYLTMAATLVSRKVGTTICQGEAGVFMHGPTFMGNPLACAIANQSIDLLLQNPWQTTIANITSLLQTHLTPCLSLSQVKDCRILGTIGVIELHQAIDMKVIQPAMVNAGVWIRPFGKLVYIMPPYIIDESGITKLCKAMYDVIKKHC